MFVIANCRISKAALDALKAKGFIPILTKSAKYLQEGVSAHPDMLFFCGFGQLFCHKEYYAENAALIDQIRELYHAELVLSDEPTGKKYPLDVLFNACIVGNRIICNPKTVSKMILSVASSFGLEMISVPQGYTKCSICAVSDNALITADRAIAEACEKVGIDVLKVSEGHVSLPPYNFGFIGGASGAFESAVYFCGSVDKHPDGEAIKDFCKKHDKTPVSLSDDLLQDVGSLFFIGE